MDNSITGEIYFDNRRYSDLCFGCKKDDKKHGIGSDGYHAKCLPCTHCKKGIRNGEYVDSVTLCHPSCLKCSHCGKAVVNGEYVQPHSQLHLTCQK